MGERTERDSFGEISVPEDRLWGAQTQRSLENFRIGSEKMPSAVIRALAALKTACARANRAAGKLTAEKAELIERACSLIMEGRYDSEFPLSVWQTGSGTQTNMNVNEVICGIVRQLTEGKVILHPNDDVNMSQSTNDIFPSAIDAACACLIYDRLLPALDALIDSFRSLELRYPGIVKVGRTHMQDAVPMTFAQEAGGWRASLESDRDLIIRSLEPLCALPAGGTAVGTGLNAPARFGEAVAEELKMITGKPFTSRKNKFSALSSRSELSFAHGALRTLAADLYKVASDIRLLSCGPRCGIGEIHIPENEPGSSIMPGKVNPTQCEAVTMVAARVMGNDTAVSFAASQGQLELNVYMPLLAYTMVQSVELLSDVCDSFRTNCVDGIEPDRERMQSLVEMDLMLVTALSPRTGYDAACEIAHCARDRGITLKEAAVASGLLTEEEYDRLVVPFDMTAAEGSEKNI